MRAQKNRISMSDGSRKLLCSMQGGEAVLGVNDAGGIVQTNITKRYHKGKTNSWLRVTGKRGRAGRGSHFFAVYCTPEQRFWNPEKGCYVEAGSLVAGDSVVVVRSEMGLTPIQKQVLLGKMLGDGCYVNTKGISAYVTWGHKATDIDYINWTARGLGELASASENHLISGFGSPIIQKRTTSSAWILQHFDSFCPPPSHQKIVPEWVSENLTPISLAFWYMDDGSLGDAKDGAEEKALFAVCGFTKSDCEVLIRGLSRLGITAVFYQDGESRYSRLRLNADDAERLFLLVVPYVPPSMQYKLPLRYRGHQAWLPSKDQQYKPLLVRQTISAVEVVDEARDTGCLGIETGTGNFFSNGVLVCNSKTSEAGHCHIGQPKETACPSIL